MNGRQSLRVRSGQSRKLRILTRRNQCGVSARAWSCGTDGLTGYAWLETHGFVRHTSIKHGMHILMANAGCGGANTPIVAGADTDAKIQNNKQLSSHRARNYFPYRLRLRGGRYRSKNLTVFSESHTAVRGRRVSGALSAPHPSNMNLCLGLPTLL